MRPVGVSGCIKTEEMEEKYHFIRMKVGIERGICSCVLKKHAQLIKHPYIQRCRI